MKKLNEWHASINNNTMIYKTGKLIMPLFVLLIILFMSGCGNKQISSPNSSLGESDGPLDIKGSDTLLQLAASMAETYNVKNPNADITVTGGGSGTGIASLLNGDANMANSSRDIKDKEIKKANERGTALYKFIVARDGLSIIVNKENSLEKLTVDQVAKIFKGEINNWRSINGPDKKINLYGRQSTSGTYEFMQKEIIKDDYSATMRNMEGNQSIIDAVANDENSVGYVGAGYAAGSKDIISILNIAINKTEEYYSPLDADNITNGSYPITRPLYQIVADVPRKGSLIHSFFLFEMSGEGNEIIRESGYFPPNTEDLEINKKLLLQ